MTIITTTDNSIVSCLFVLVHESNAMSFKIQQTKSEATQICGQSKCNVYEILILQCLFSGNSLVHFVNPNQNVTMTTTPGASFTSNSSNSSGYVINKQKHQIEMLLYIGRNSTSLLSPMSVVEFIESVSCVCVCVWTY